MTYCLKVTGLTDTEINISMSQCFILPWLYTPHINIKRLFELDSSSLCLTEVLPKDITGLFQILYFLF